MEADSRIERNRLFEIAINLNIDITDPEKNHLGHCKICLEEFTYTCLMNAILKTITAGHTS
jgi:hypothetical protein